MDDTDNTFCVDVIGFNATERLLLNSIFGLAARRDPGFRQREAGTASPADLYLVDGSDENAAAEFRAIRARFPAPAVFVGTANAPGGAEAIERPIQWARLLQCMDDAIVNPVAHAAADEGFEKTMVLRRTGAPAAGAGVRTPPPAAAARPLPKPRAITDTVLVVDDNATVRRFMESKLAPFGFSVDFAETGEQAVGLTGNREYTCVFLDVVLPGIDGYQVCKLIKGNKQAVKRTAVVMLTSRSSPFDKLRGSLAGCDEYLTKPVDENHLLEVIAKFLPSARAVAA
jgi:two-component system cell cycle response regulator